MLVFAFGDSRTPLNVKFFLILAFLYLISPIDLIPDFIPVAGWIDDLVIVPTLMALAFKQLPLEVYNDVQEMAKKKVWELKLVVVLLIIGFLAALSSLSWLLFF